MLPLQEQNVLGKQNASLRVRGTSLQCKLCVRSFLYCLLMFHFYLNINSFVQECPIFMEHFEKADPEEELSGQIAEQDQLK